MRTLFRLGLVVAIALLAVGAQAHPAGLTSVNRYIGVACDGPSKIRIDYLLDFAELPSFTELQDLDADRNGTVTPEEQHAYLDRRLPPLLAQWDVDVDGAKASPHVTGANLETTEGERGMPTLRIAAEIAVDVPAAAAGASAATPISAHSGDVRVHVRDRTFSDRPGWREIAAEDSPFAAVVAGPKEAPSGALDYASAIGGPPRVDEAQMSFRPHAGDRLEKRPPADVPEANPPPGRTAPPTSARFVSLTAVVILAIVLAILVALRVSTRSPRP